MKKITTFFAVGLASVALAQSDSTKTSLTFSGYLETYYAYDFGKPVDHNRASFIYSHNRTNEVNLNLGYIKAAYSKGKVRSNLALMAGTYSNANLASEQGLLKNIFEANIGLKLAKKHNLWLDAGVFSSHIGFESAISKDCWTLTRSLLADNSPYYESGAKVTFISKSEKWQVSGLLLNGWQRIQRVDGNNALCFGHQLIFKPSDRITWNSSSFIGSDTPDSVRRMRYFHNFYGQIQLHKKIGMIVGLDVGVQQKQKGSSNYNSWFSPVLILKYELKPTMFVALRGEYYSDEAGVIIATSTQNGFQTLGCSLNFDYALSDNLVWRMEAKGYRSKDAVFSLDNQPSNQNYVLTTSFAISF